MNKFLVFIMVVCVPLAKAADLAKWRELPGQDKPSYWLLAFEEAEFIRTKIGDWLVIATFKTETDAPLGWRLNYIRRRDNQCELSMSFVGQKKLEVTQKYSWFDKGPNAEIDGEPLETEKEVYIDILQGDRSKRRIWLRRADGISELRETVKISKAMLMWTWDKVTPYDL